MEELYRPCVGIMLVNAESKVFVGRRIDQNSDAWQMPQGGIDADELPPDAAKRELLEETSIASADFVAISDDWFYYDIPTDVTGGLWQGKFKGQKQLWFLMRFFGSDDEINLHTLHPEFSEWKWCEIEELVPGIVTFKRDVYQKVIDQFLPIIKNG